MRLVAGASDLATYGPLGIIVAVLLSALIAATIRLEKRLDRSETRAAGLSDKLVEVSTRSAEGHVAAAGAMQEMAGALRELQLQLARQGGG